MYIYTKIIIDSMGDTATISIYCINLLQTKTVRKMDIYEMTTGLFLNINTYLYTKIIIDSMNDTE